MNRDDIVAKMALREREIFEKYKDTYPFPIKEYIEELEIEIISHKDDEQAGITKKNDRFYIIISGKYLEKETSLENKAALQTLLSHELMHYFFDQDQFTENGNLYFEDQVNHCGRITNIRSWSFLMPPNVFRKKRNELVSLKKVAEYFMMPLSVVKDYSRYVDGKVQL